VPHSKGWRKRKDERTLEETPIGAIVDGLMRERVFARGAPNDWAAVVGERLAAASSPVSLDGGVLVVATTEGAWGAQVRFLAEEIRKKANRTLGVEEVRRVHVVVRSETPKPL
jgi:predicted nucleic acid-binding Zn ribbon protein